MPAHGEATYDGFISYSHAADGLLAPRLQAGLQRFAKPWWQRRALRIFRDESSLSANPHLWSSITEALDESEWFVLLLSPDAAQSEWVNQEVAYWVEHKDPDRIIPVVTAGEFGWDGDVTGSAAPAALRGVLAEEPRWVDARGLGDPDRLDLKDPEFAAVVADLAAPLRGVPKDELASEEVRQHKRTVRTAWAAGVVVLVLAVAAAGFGVQSARNADEAQRQAEIAQENEEEAQRQQGVAEEEARRAEEQEAVARARQLAASAVTESTEDAQLSLLLALTAIDRLPEGVEPGPVLENGLRSSMTADRLLARYDSRATPGPSQIDLSPDGATVAFVSTPRRVVELLDSESLEPLWSVQLDTDDLPQWVAFSSSGEFLAVAMADASWDQLGDFVEGEPSGEPDGRFLLLDPSDGSLLHSYVVPGSCVVNLTPGGLRDDLGLIGFGYQACDPAERPGSVKVVETEAWATVYERTEVGNWPHVVFADDANWAAAFSGFNTGTISWLLDPSTWEVVRELDFPWGDLSPDGEMLAGAAFEQVSGVFLEDTVTGSLRDRFTQDLQFPWDPEFSPDGTKLVYGTFGDVTYAYDARTGVQLEELRTGPTERVAFDGSFLYTVSEGVVSRWDVAGLLAGDLNTEPLGLWVNGNSIRWAGDTRVAVVADRSRGTWYFYPVAPDGSLGQRIQIAGFAESDGEGEPPEIWWSTPISGGRVAVFRAQEREGEALFLGPLEVLDLATGEYTVVAGCWMEEAAAYRHEICPDGSEHPGGQIGTSRRDGSEFMVLDYVQPAEAPSEIHASIWDAEDLTVTQRISLGEIDAFQGQLSRSILTEEYVVVHVGPTFEMIIVDRSTGERVEFDQGAAAPQRGIEHDRAQNRIWTADPSGALWVLDLDDRSFRQVTEPLPTAVRALATSPSGEKVAAGGADNVLRVYSDEGEVLHIIPMPNPSDAWWLDETHLVVGTGNGPWTTITLESDELVAIARLRVRRGFTPEECQFYALDPCPTLEELRGES